MPQAKTGGEIVAITGATAGVGRATAHRFARAGARLGLIARDEKALEAVRQEVQSLGGTALAIAADVADADAVFAAAGRVEDEMGPRWPGWPPRWAGRPDDRAGACSADAAARPGRRAASNSASLRASFGRPKGFADVAKLVAAHDLKS